MDPDEMMCADSWAISSSGHETTNSKPKDLPFTRFNAQPQGWEDPSFLDFVMTIEQQPSGFNLPSEAQAPISYNPNNQNQVTGLQKNEMSGSQDSDKNWDPTEVLNNLSFLEKKIHQLQDVVHMVVGERAKFMGRKDELMAQQQQLITADLTSIIVQLISTAGSLLPSVKSNLPSASHVSQFGQLRVPNPSSALTGTVENKTLSKVEDQSNMSTLMDYCGTEKNCIVDDHEMKSDDEHDERENLPPGSYEILQLEKEEILAPHTHFCTICGKGFKRDANLRMHMRGHGDVYKTPAALAKPAKESSCAPVLIKRYSCPYIGCKRNKDHKKFQPLKTILCVKNHYKRTHCDKTYTCSRCHMKKFSVIADLKTHEKHCGRDKWLCSCGTTFSRKDKLFGHIALFQGHTPAIPLADCKGSGQGEVVSEASDKAESDVGFASSAKNGSMSVNVTELKGSGNDPASCFSPVSIHTSGVGFQDFSQTPFEDSECSFLFLLSDSCDYAPKS